MKGVSPFDTGTRRRHSPNVTLLNVRPAYSPLILEARITLPHFSVSSALSFAEFGARARKQLAAEFKKLRLGR
jgi:hypothetical protein